MNRKQWSFIGAHLDLVKDNDLFKKIVTRVIEGKYPEISISSTYSGYSLYVDDNNSFDFDDDESWGIDDILRECKDCINEKKVSWDDFLEYRRNHFLCSYMTGSIPVIKGNSITIKRCQFVDYALTGVLILSDNNPRYNLGDVHNTFPDSWDGRGVTFDVKNMKVKTYKNGKLVINGCTPEQLKTAKKIIRTYCLLTDKFDDYNFVANKYGYEPLPDIIVNDTRAFAY